MTCSHPRESRRQVLVATIALQRFALRGDIGSLRMSLSLRNWWEAPLRLVRLASFAGRCWSVGAAAVRLMKR
jgi:hypothetical protein